MDPIISSTLANLYNLSDLRIGEFQFAQIFGYFPFLESGLNSLKSVMVFLTGVILVLFVVVIVKLNKISGRKTNIIKNIAPPTPAVSGTNARWEEIKKHISSTREAEWKFAVIEADKLVDDTLKNAGFPGETLGERLMNIDQGQLTTLNGLWEAHKIRNRLAHETNYFLRYIEAKRAIELYEKTLRELQAI